jgi:hypothetical protein
MYLPPLFILPAIEKEAMPNATDTFLTFADDRQ